MILAVLTSSILLLASASPALEDDVRRFLPNLNYSWPLLKGDEGCACFSSSPIPCRPQIAYECEIPTDQMVLVEAAGEVYEGEELVVRATVCDNGSGIYRTLSFYSIDGGVRNYVDMELERRYLVEPACGYGFQRGAIYG